MKFHFEKLFQPMSFTAALNERHSISLNVEHFRKTFLRMHRSHALADQFIGPSCQVIFLLKSSSKSLIILVAS